MGKSFFGISSKPRYTRSTREGDSITISGHIGTRDGKLVSDDAGQQTTQALDNMAEAVRGSGGRPGDIRRIRGYIASQTQAEFDERYGGFNGAYEQWMDAQGIQPPPARTVVGVSRLPFGAIVEVDADAKRPRWSLRRRQ